MKIIFLGAPGAGKGTQADIVAKKLGIPTISTGNMLREAIKNGTELGLKMKQYTENGQLVPDDVIMGIVAQRLAEPDCAKGYILDGMPRTTAQAEALEKIGIEIDDAISIEIDDEVIEERMEGRRVCEHCGASYHIHANPSKVEGVCDSCGGKLVIRKDDAPETVKERLRVFHEQTEPIKGFYEARGKLKLVRGDQPIADATAEIMAALGE